ncbi:MAG: class I SAM-dependent methyltransferase [Nevskia sp.]|nr:class I SAM-dependent methyltransferase [Nevskia sp.]
MTAQYWDRVAASWDEHIMSSLHEDVSGNISALIAGAATTHRRILDYGCGIGGYLPLLSSQFEQVVAVDSSRACVRRARALATALPNVTVCLPGQLPRRGAQRLFDVVLMANVLIQPQEAQRAKILGLALEHLRLGGVLLLVVPSVESVHLSEAVRRAYTQHRNSAYSATAGARGFDPGLIAIQGRPTKHYSADEITVLLASRRLAVNDILRAEYSWRSEAFEGLDRRIERRPWDWVVSAVRR